MSYGLGVTVPADPSVPSGDAPVVPAQAHPPLVLDDADAGAAEPAEAVADAPLAEAVADDPSAGPVADSPPAALPAPPAIAELTTGFRVTLANFEGPFDLLLQLIGRHKLEITEVSLSKVTNEFIAYIKAMGDDWDLGEASEFLVVAATLLDLKAARLLPAAAVEDEEDLALLEARDLLFARLLQYKAFKEAAAFIAQLSETGNRRWARAVGLEPRFAEALPDLVLGIGPARLAALAARAMTPKQPPVVSIDHIHLVRVSVREHAAALREKLARLGTATFRYLCADCASTLEVVARFLALLELYRENMVSFDQAEALGELTVRWTGQEIDTELDIDEYAGTPGEALAGEPAAAPEPEAVDAVAPDAEAPDAVALDTVAPDAEAGVAPAAPVEPPPGEPAMESGEST